MAPACHMLHGGAASAAAIHIYDLITSEINTFHVVFSNFSVEKRKTNKLKENKTENSELRPSCLDCQVGWESAFHFALCAVKCCVNDFSFCSVDCWIIHNKLLWQPSRIQKQNSIDCYCCCCCQKNSHAWELQLEGGGGAGFATWAYAQYARIAVHSFCCLYPRLGSSSAEARGTTATNN